MPKNLTVKSDWFYQCNLTVQIKRFFAVLRMTYFFILKVCTSFYQAVSGIAQSCIMAFILSVYSRPMI